MAWADTRRGFVNLYILSALRALLNTALLRISNIKTLAKIAINIFRYALSTFQKLTIFVGSATYRLTMPNRSTQHCISNFTEDIYRIIVCLWKLASAYDRSRKISKCGAEEFGNICIHQALLLDC